MRHMHGGAARRTSTDDTSHARGGPQPRVLTDCILWHVRGEEPDSELLSALSRRPGFRIAKVDNQFAAMAAVCTRRRMQPGPAPSPQATVLLIVDPVGIAHAGEVAQLLARYAPDAFIWVFDAAAPEKLRGVTEGDIAMWASQKEAEHKPEIRVLTPPSLASGPTPRTIAPAATKVVPDAVAAQRVKYIDPTPRLRLAGDDAPAVETNPDSPAHTPPVARAAAATQPSPKPAQPAPPAPSSMLTDEELAMLLSTDDR